MDASGGKSGLKFAMFQVYRTNEETSPAVGNDFDFINMIDPASLPDPKELDYATLLKPDLERMKRLLEMALAGIGDGEDTKDSRPKTEGITGAIVKY